MVFLPIVHRELRVAARRKATLRVRWWTALLGMAVGFVSLGLVLASGPTSGRGDTLFAILSGYAFGISCLAGVFLTADAIAREKREGTLGFLFLTDLKGYDVVLGKFVSSSLNAFYALLALLPLTALPFLLGGVTGGQFWRTATALLNTLFVSLGAGICVSVFVKDSQRAIGNALGSMLLLVVALPALAALTRGYGIAWFSGRLASASPLYPFIYAPELAFQPHKAAFWSSLIVSHLTGWSFVMLASWRLPRAWQETGDSTPGRIGRAFQGIGARRQRPRKPLLDANPVSWLMGDQRVLRRLLWFIVGLWAVGVAAMQTSGRAEPLEVLYPAKACGFVLKILVALQACRFFVEARTNGALELLLCTPLRSGEILRGQWLALKRIFLFPLSVFLLLVIAPFVMRAGAAVLNWRSGVSWSGVLVSGGGALLLGGHVLGFVADVVALCVAGMWLSLSVKRPNYAAAYTILFVLVLPSVFLCGVSLVADLFFILWGGSKLQRDFRWVLSRPMDKAVVGLVYARASRNVPPVIPGRAS